MLIAYTYLRIVNLSMINFIVLINQCLKGFARLVVVFTPNYKPICYLYIIVPFAFLIVPLSFG